jgi:hypothetical protein
MAELYDLVLRRTLLLSSPVITARRAYRKAASHTMSCPLAGPDQARDEYKLHNGTRGLATNLAGRNGRPEIKQELLKGQKVGEKTFKTHLDGHNLFPLHGRNK